MISIFPSIQAGVKTVYQRCSQQGSKARSLAINVSKRTVAVGMLVFLLWNLAAPAQAAEYRTNERGNIQSTDVYQPMQEKQGGMNNYSDTDPRRNTAQAEAKAKKLSDTAERRKMQASDPLEPARETIDQATDRAEQAVEDIVK